MGVICVKRVSILLIIVALFVGIAGCVSGVPGSELVVGETSTAARFLNSVTSPDMEPFSGNLLYIDNVTPIERAEDQIEDFKIILNF